MQDVCSVFRMMDVDWCRLGFVGAHPLRGVLCAQTYDRSAYQLLRDVGLSTIEKEEEHQALLNRCIVMQHSGCVVRLAKDSVCVLYQFQPGLS